MNSLVRFVPYGFLLACISSELGCSSAEPAGDPEPVSSSSSVSVSSLAARAVGPSEPPATCTPFISPEVAAHVREMAQKGWGAVNKEKGMLMHGCREGQRPRDCLSSYPRSTEKAYAKGWEHLAGASLRIVREFDYPSSYWTRTSPDGRFVGHGRARPDAATGLAASITDLNGRGRTIPVNATYDSGFIADNSGFTFISGGDVMFCKQSLLASSPRTISFDEPECMHGGDLGLYQSVGASLGGTDYWVAGGQFQNDQGGYDVRQDPPPNFGQEAISFTPMIHTGSAFETGTTIKKTLPHEGDAILSPSAKVFMTRIEGPESRLLGYALHKLVATSTPSGYTLDTPEIARYCTSQGAKATFSFDERWAVIHHYIVDGDAKELGFTGPDDPKFAPYRAQGGSNVYLMDLLTGKTQRITQMQPGQYALYPHFRSDGWIHFLVRTAPTAGTPTTATEYLVASDAALVQP